MFSKPVDEVGAEETLDAVEVWRGEQIDRETRTFAAAAHFADLHSGDARDRSGRVLPGMESARRLGGQGTPKVLEFAAAEFAARDRQETVRRAAVAGRRRRRAAPAAAAVGAGPRR